MVNTGEEIIMTELMTRLLERLTEMFPKQDYQSRLERYIASHRPQSVGDIELLEKEFTHANSRGFIS